MTGLDYIFAFLVAVVIYFTAVELGYFVYKVFIKKK